MEKKKVYHEDKLVRRIVLPDGRLIHHGKRVGADCPLTRVEIREYVRFGAVNAVKLIRDGRGCSLSEALNLLNKARGWSVRQARCR